MKHRVIFVCLGNICRSPAAEGVFKSMVKSSSKLKNSYIIDSAGTYSGHSGEKADSRMRRAASKRGYNLDSISRGFNRSDFDNFDLIVVMDDSNYRDVRAKAITLEEEEKVVRFATFCSNSEVSYVPDPYYEGAEGFEIVLDILEDGCKNLLSKLEED